MRKMAIIVLAALAVNLSAGENLLPNGDFDDGAATPSFWDAADGLTSFWIMESGRGRILKLDTRPARSQALAWWELRKKDPAAKPPPPEIPKDELASIAGWEGTFIDSGFIPVKPGQNYKLTVDYKGNYKPFVWIKGFMVHPKRNFPVDCYQTRLEPSGGHADAWRTYSIGFNPTAKMPKTDRMKVRVYAYWKPGVYCFDRIRIEEITPEEMAELVKTRGETK